MKQYLTRKNIGLALTGLLALLLVFSAFGKISGNAQTLELMNSHNLGDWVTIIGVGELISIILFAIPKTMRLGAVLLSAYFGGAIMFHMAHPSPDPELTNFTAPAVLLVIVWGVAWLRGLKLIDMGTPSQA